MSDDTYKYQVGSTTRKYRFEVSDWYGVYLAHCDRTITAGPSISSSAFNLKQFTIVGSTPITVTDGGYKQGYHAIPIGDFFTATAPTAYFGFINAELCMTVSMNVAEKDDGYQYIAFMVDNTTKYDKGAHEGTTWAFDIDNNYTYPFAKYMAGFCHRLGTKETTYASYSFPLTSEGAVYSGNTIQQAWSSLGNTVGALYSQNFYEADDYRASDGRFKIPVGTSTLGLRFDASGHNGDSWYAKNIVANIQAVDSRDLTITYSRVAVSGGIHAQGNTVYVSVPFNKIVGVTGTPTLETAWGTLDYFSGSGTNVLTFRGTITAAPGTELSLRDLKGIVGDLSGNAPSNIQTRVYTYRVNYVPWSGSGTEPSPYIIYTATDLNQLASRVNAGEGFTNTYFKLGADITYSHTTDWDYLSHSSTDENNFTAIGGWGNSFKGVFDGDGHTISGIRICKSGNTDYDGSQGLFGYVAKGTVKNLILADANIFGKKDLGGIVGYLDGGTVSNCLLVNVRVASRAETDNSRNIIAGTSIGNSTITRAHYRDCCIGRNTGTAFVNDRKDDLFTLSHAANVTLPARTGTALTPTVTFYADGATIDGTDYYTAGTALTLSYTGEVPSGSFVRYSATRGTDDVTASAITGNTLTMPNGDATIATTILPVVSYMAVDGTMQYCNDYTPITSSNSNVTLGANGKTHWYVVSSDATINGLLELEDKEANIILCDGASLTINNNYSTALHCYNLNLYGQSLGMGTLSALSYTTGIGCRDLSVNGVIVNATGINYGILAGSHTITLGYSSVAYRITASKYLCDALVVKDGQTLADGIGHILGGSYTGDALNELLTAIKGQTLQPAFVLTLADGVTATGDAVGTLQGTTYAPASAAVTLGYTSTVAKGYEVVYAVDGTAISGNSFTMPAASVSVSNSFTPVTYTIGYELDGGTVATANPTTYTVETASFTLVNPTREGYIFAGWTGTDLDSPTMKVTIDKGTAGNLEYTATWTPVYALHLGTSITTTTSPAVTKNEIGYYTAGTEVTLGYSGTVTAGYVVVYSVNGNAISGNSFEMPAEEATVDAVLNIDYAYFWGADNDGSEEKPYVITTTAGLDLLASEVNSGNQFSGLYFELGKDITYSHGDGTTENNYTAIGNSDSNYFRGTFDGKGHSVIGIRIYKDGNTDADNFQGLFGFTSTTVKNVTLTDARITGYQGVGGIVGSASGGTIENCHVTNSVVLHAVADGACVYGGIVGSNGSSVYGCTSSARFTLAEGISGCSAFGGITGSNAGQMDFCLAHDVSIPLSMADGGGAIIGTTVVDEGSFHNYYHGCTVGGQKWNIGCGRFETSPTDYTTGDILMTRAGHTISGDTDVTIALAGTATKTYDYNGIAVYQDKAGEIGCLSYDGMLYAEMGSFFSLILGYTGTPPAHYELKGYTTDIELMDADHFYMGGNDVTISAVFGPDYAYFWGAGNDGSAERPYVITTTDGLDALALEVNRGVSFKKDDNHPDGYFFLLGNDIAYKHTTAWNDANSTETNYTRIGNHKYPFCGHFDGDGHIVSGIRIYKNGLTRDGDGYQGLFGNIESKGTVKNVTIVDTRITATIYAAGIAGFGLNGRIENCHVTKTVCIHALQSESSCHAGIVGSTRDGGLVIEGCTSSVTLTMADGLHSCMVYGGIIGYKDWGAVKNCIAIGTTITSNGYSGAIAGMSSLGELSHNYYSGCSVDGATTNIGCGLHEDDTNSYTGDITEHDGAVPATILSETEPVPTDLSGKVVFHRQFTGGKASTICLPFAYEKGDEGTYYTFGGVAFSSVEGKWTATMNEYTGSTLEANMPYLFIPAGTDAFVPILFIGDADYDGSQSLVTGSATNWQFKGVYAGKTWAAADCGRDYGFSASDATATDGTTAIQAGDFVKVGASTHIAPLRAYLSYMGSANPWETAGARSSDPADLPGSISVILRHADGETTSLTPNPSPKGEGSEYWYTLDGRKVQGKPTQKGVYIVNGRKVLLAP